LDLAGKVTTLLNAKSVQQHYARVRINQGATAAKEAEENIRRNAAKLKTLGYTFK
jgi:hypothetical protein